MLKKKFKIITDDTLLNTLSEPKGVTSTLAFSITVFHTVYLISRILVSEGFPPSSATQNACQNLNN